MPFQREFHTVGLENETLELNTFLQTTYIQRTFAVWLVVLESAMVASAALVVATHF